MRTTTRNTSLPGSPIVSRTWYYYTAGGNVRRVVTREYPGQMMVDPGIDGAEPDVVYNNDCEAQGLIELTAIRFEYACNAATVTYAAGERWCGDPNNLGAPPVDGEVTWAREFRYDGARQRYSSFELEPMSFQNGSVVGLTPFTLPMATRYDSNAAFADYDQSPAFPLRAFEPGIGRIEPYDPNDWQNASTDYYHTDHLGTVRVMTASTGLPLDLNGSTSSGHDMVFTAFGEIVVGISDGGSDRYGYVGVHGYQAHDEMPFLHVGARYYDPSIGRFLQRDPIGLLGGLNTYSYVQNVPTSAIDPSGLSGSVNSPQGTMQLIITDIDMAGSSLVSINGTTHIVTNVITTQAGGSTTATLVTNTGRHVATWTYKAGDTWGKGTRVVRTSRGVAIECGGGACGATGIEAVPVLFWYFWRTRRLRMCRASRSQTMPVEGCS